MNPAERQKMCIKCDGRIPLDADLCPYCGAIQEGAGGDRFSQTQLFQQQSLQESLTSLYSPPYSKGSGSMNSINSEDNKYSSKRKNDGFKDVSAEKRFTANLGAPELAVNEEELRHEEEKSSFWPLLLLSIATTLVTIGLLQFFFSDDGFLHLEWDSSYWFIYCLISLPLFFLGLKKANKL